MILRTSFANQHLQFDHDHSQEFSPRGRVQPENILLIKFRQFRNIFTRCLNIETWLFSIFNIDLNLFFSILIFSICYWRGRCLLPDVYAFSKGKMQRSPSNRPWRTMGGGEWRSAIDGVGGQRHVRAALPSRQRAGAHCTGGWVGPTGDLDGLGKSRPPPPPPTGIRSPDRPTHSESIYWRRCMLCSPEQTKSSRSSTFDAVSHSSRPES
jgi:hypothetical protein